MEAFAAAGGYEPRLRFAFRAIREGWRCGAARLQVGMLLPDGTGPYPVVVYLPGLGEGVDAAPLWQEAWARAGYAVVALQPEAAAQALRGLGRGGRRDLAGIGRSQFSRKALERRLDQLSWCLAELLERVRRRQPPFAALDLTKVAVAGFDLGAQATAALAGEVALARPSDWNGIRLRSAIVLSPLVDLALGKLNSRFKSIRLPLLAVTGEEDRDPWGISSPSLRPAIWQQGPPGDQYLLLLPAASHRDLGGALAVEEPAEGDGADWLPQGPEGGRRRSAPLEWEARPRPADGREQAAIRSVTTAFLDATVKGDAHARRWLQQAAPGWLGPVGVLKVR